MTATQNNIDKPAERFVTPEECQEIYRRIQKFCRNIGRTSINIEGNWTGNIRWARNEIMSSGDVRDNQINISRAINGADAIVATNTFAEKYLSWSVSKAERFLQFYPERPEDNFLRQPLEKYELPKLWYDSTFNMLSKERVAVAESLIIPAEKNGLLAAGYIAVSGSARSISIPEEEPVFVRYTRAQLSVTVRDPQGKGSGWAGVDWNDWSRIDGTKLTEIAIDKCLRSMNPVAVEPGRYNTVMEPQAVHNIAAPCFSPRILSRTFAEDRRQPSPYSGITRQSSKIGLRVFDERITVTHNPMDNDCSFVPVANFGDVYNNATWVKNGVLTSLAHSRKYGIEMLGINSGLPSMGAYSMTGGNMSVEEMIERTERGLLITRFSDIEQIDMRSLLYSGYTRDGLWLIEKGKISKAVKNMKFTDSPLHTFNNIIELGTPQRVFSPNAPAVVPAIMSRDFSLTATIEAI